MIYPDEACIFAAVCAALFCIFGVVGNGLTILALLKCQRLRKHATTKFLISLTFSDLLFCMFSMPLTASRYLNKEWIFGVTMCQVFAFIFYSNITVSMLSMILMTLNRYVLITFQHLYTKIYKTHWICLQLLLAWGISFMIMIPPLIGAYGQLGLDVETFSCTILKKAGKSPKKHIFLVGFVLPCFIIVLSYSCIFWTVRKQNQKMSKFDTLAPKTKTRFFKNKNDLKLTIMMLTIFICFVLCFLPLMLVNVFDDDTKYPTLHILASVFAWSSAVINPIIYAVGSSQYRNAYKNLFVQIKTWRNSSSSGNNNKQANSRDTAEQNSSQQKQKSNQNILVKSTIEIS